MLRTFNVTMALLLVASLYPLVFEHKTPNLSLEALASVPAPPAMQSRG